MKLFDRDTILSHLGEVAAELGAGHHETVVIVGGSMLALTGLREATMDVDTAERHSPALRNAVERVARRHDLAPDWLNSSASAWVPAADIVRLIDTEPVLDLPTLTAYAASADAVFIMKAHAARPVDLVDLVALWPRCSFASFDEAAAACNEAYAHLTEPDEHLASWLAEIIERPHGPARGERQPPG